MMQIKRYERVLEEDFLQGKMHPKLFNTYFDFYNTILKYWDEILSSSIPSDYQALIAKILLIYDDREKLSEFYLKFKSFEIFASFSRIVAIQGDYSKIEEIIEKLDKGEINTQLIYLFDFFLHVVEYYSVINKLEQAEEYLNKALEILDQISEFEKDKKLCRFYEIKYLYTETLINYMKHQYIKGIYISERALQKILKHDISDVYLHAYLLNMQGNCLLYSGSIIESKVAYAEEIKLFSSEKIERGKIVAKANYAVVLLKQGFFKEGLKHLFNILIFMEKKKELRNIAMINAEIIYAYRLLNNIPESLKFLEKAIKISEQYNIALDYIYPLAAETYSISNNFDKSRLYLEKYSKIFKLDEPKLNAYYTTYITTKGIFEFYKMNYYSSRDYLLKGINYARELNLFPQALNALLYLIELYLVMFKIETNKINKQKILEEIELYSQEIIILLKELNAFYQLVNYMLLLATVYIYTNKLHLSEDLLKRVEIICKKHDLNYKEENIRQIYQLLKKAKSNTEFEQTPFSMDFSLEIDNLIKQYTTKGLLTSEIRSSRNNFHLFHFLLIVENVPFYSYSYGDIFHSDELLIVGMINAIKNISKTLKLKKGELRILEHSEYVMLLLGKSEFTIALFVDRFSYALKKKTEEIAVLIEKKLLEYPHEDILEYEEIKEYIDTKIKEVYFE
ncbi:MAG: tetratricopeptide repeat protein [Candidatus Heimdallarchaeaceae archaeon]